MFLHSHFTRQTTQARDERDGGFGFGIGQNKSFEIYTNFQDEI